MNRVVRENQCHDIYDRRNTADSVGESFSRAGSLCEVRVLIALWKFQGSWSGASAHPTVTVIGGSAAGGSLDGEHCARCGDGREEVRLLDGRRGATNY